jgi:hypothetical protein
MVSQSSPDWAAIALACFGALAFPAPGIASTFAPDANTLASIARDIEGLKGTYPQIGEFSSQSHLNTQRLTISYAYRTHKARHPGGWTSGVPNPDEDGIWFHIDFHDPASAAQIHTQPMTIRPHCLSDMRVGFLLLEGPGTTSVNAALWGILKKHGVAQCRPNAGE